MRQRFRAVIQEVRDSAGRVLIGGRHRHRITAIEHGKCALGSQKLWPPVREICQMASEHLLTATSTSLLEGVRALDAQAWRRMVELYGPLVYRWCRRWHLGAEDSKDVVQEVFGAVASHVRDFHRDNERGGFRAWLFTITRNKIRDFFRRRGAEPCGQGGTDAFERLSRIAGPGTAEEVLSAERGDRILLVRRAVCLAQAEFEERTWEMFCRVAMLAQKPAEVAAGFGVSVTAVYQAKSRVLRRLRELLEEALL